MRISSGTKQKNGGGTRGPRTERRAENPAGSNRRANQFRFEKFGDEISNSHRTPAKQVEDAFLAEAANAAAGLEQIPEILRGGRVDGGRGNGKKLAEDGGGLFEGGGKLRVLLSIFRGEMRDAAGGLGVIVVKEERAAVGGGREDARVRPEDFAAKSFELHVARDVSAERAESMRERGSVKTWMKFFGDGAATDKFAAF